MSEPSTVPSSSLVTSSETSKKRRRAITNAEKKQIREFFFDKAHTKPPNLKAVQTWFQENHQRPGERPIAISSLCEITSKKKYAALDSHEGPSTESQLREAYYPDLEAALYEFQLRMN